MLSYLDALIAALAVRDTSEAERLMAHPLARLLPEDVRAEAMAFTNGERDALAAPLRTLQLRHQTAELLREMPEIADAPAVARPAAGVEAKAPKLRRALPRQHQMELPLSA